MGNTFQKLYRVVDAEWCSNSNYSNYDASVAIIYIEQLDSIIFIERTEKPNDRWSGHIAFPGGFRKGHESSLETAIREVNEELNIDLNRSMHLGAIKPLRTRLRNIVIVPHIFLLKSKPETLKANSMEVSRVFIVDVGSISMGQCPSYIPYPPCFLFPEISKGKVVWGLTARILSLILDSN